MMKFYCNHVDKLGMAAYHETDKPENVKFYERFCHEVIGEESIMGFQDWYLWRSPNGWTSRDKNLGCVTETSNEGHSAGCKNK
jgi:hypothetical protein